MADDADRADEITQNRIDGAIAMASERCAQARALIPMMACYNCGDPVPQHHVYCSSECSVDHRHLMDRNKANGK